MEKILIVDDEPDVVGFVQSVLKVENYEVIVAYDGIAALDLAETEKPDLILLDLMMPMMSGYEVCEQLKANPQTKDIPIICFSSAHAPNARANCLKAGAVMLLVKPFMPAELVAQVHRYVRKTSDANPS